MMKKYIPLLIIMLFLCTFTWNASGQRKQQVKTVTIESVIVDESGTPVPNAVVYGKEGAIEVLTDANGRFSIEVPENSTILIEAEGFDSQTLPSSLVPQNLALNKKAFLMDESSMVNIPFGKVTKREAVGAMSVINTDEILKYDRARNVYDIINSRALGLFGSQNVRGIGNAVYIVDGLPRDPSKLLMEEIDQVTVVKDANAAMLYGGHSSRGVILITTKRGEAHKRRINVTVEQGFSTPIVLPKYLNSADYMTLYNEALANDGILQPAWHDSVIQKYDSGNPYRYPSVDYYSSEFLKNSRPISKYYAEFSGGSNITQYYANVGWIRSGTLYNVGEGANANNNQFNVRANVNVQINDYVKGYVDAVAIFNFDKGPNGDFWGNAATLRPYYFSPLIPTSYVKSDAAMTGGASLLTAKLVNGNNILGGTTQYTDNVYGNMVVSGYNNPIERNINLNNGFEIDLRDLVDGLKFKTFFSFDLWSAYALSVNNSYAVYAPTWQTFGTRDSIVALQKIGTDMSTGVQNTPVAAMSFNRSAGINFSLDYAKTFNVDHTVKALLLGFYSQYKVDNVIVDVQTAHVGLRVSYDYADKYFADFSSVYLNGYKLMPGNKGGFSPSIGLGWVISEEDFLVGNSIINYLKLRASAGIVNYEFSNANYRLYDQTYIGSTFGPSFAWNDGTTSGRITYLARAGNPDLTFEKIKNINIGFESYLFNNSLFIDANLFTSRNTGIVVQRTSYYSALVGREMPYENYNETGYSGGELGIMLSKSYGDFSFDLGVNTLYSTSKALKRDEVWENDYQYREGKPNDAMFGYEAIGFYASEAEINNPNTPVVLLGQVKPGDIKYKDQNDDKFIDSNDQIEIGNSQPRFSYGIHATLKYKDFSLFAIGNGTQGSDFYFNNAYFWVQGTGKYSEEVRNRWTPATASTATYPRLSSANNPNNFTNSTFWMHNENYFYLDRVQLTYEFPANISRKLVSKDINIYLRGDNLAMFAKDADKRQLQIGAQPLYRNYALGLTVKF